jgi:hypothetical protein
MTPDRARLWKLLQVALMALAWPAAAWGQATVDNNSANANQIAARLDGPGVSISGANIPTANGSDTATMYGLFSNGASGGFGISTGAALSTGTIAEMFTSNSSISATQGNSSTTYNDPQLTAIESGAIWNVAVITMNVTLDPNVVGLQFRYQFGSDEYPDYAGSTFNDLFAILISGPGITGTENIAILPTGDRTDINSINFGVRGCSQNGAPFDSSNNPYYIRNGHVTSTGGGSTLICNSTQPGPFPVVAEWNGLTEPLTARRTGLTPGATYTLKFAVADVLDHQWDSGAIFEMITGVYQRDFGDAPNTGGYGDPYHDFAAGFQLGPSATPESVGYNSPTASGDVDNGVTLAALSGGNTSTINVNTVGSGGFLQAWFDWNTDGDFNDAGEQVATNLQDTNNDGWITLSVTPPATAVSYDTYARFRWSTQSGLSATANTTTGEVEDYFVNVSPASSALTCPAGYSPLLQSGNAFAVVATSPGANSPSNALGPLMPAGSGLGLGNAAQITSTATTLALDLGQIMPQNASIILSVARDDTAGVMAIDTSLDGVTWTQRLTFNGGVDDISQRVTLTGPAGGTRYLRFRRTAGNLWIDGVQYSSICQGVPQLQGTKSITVYDPGATGIYALPGNDVIYAINVANTGTVTTDTNTVLIIDAVPAQVTVFTGATPEFGGQRAGFSQTGATLAFNPSADFGYSASTTGAPANFAACNYTPVTAYDPAIKYVCANPKGVLPAGDPDPNFTLSFRARIR